MISLTHGGLLLLAPIGWLALFFAARLSRKALSRGRRVASLIVRSAGILLLTLVMTQPVLTRPVDRPFLTVFAADVSDSIPRHAWEPAFARLKSLWDREVSRGNRCALVAFGGRAQVLIPPTDRPLRLDPSLLAHRAAVERLSAAAERGDPAAGPAIADLQKWTERLQTDTTDLEQAAGTARSLFQDEWTNRLVLVTDGRDTARSARFPENALTVRLDPARNDIALSAVDAPLAVRAGEPFDVRVTVDATAAADVSLSLTVDDVSIPEAAKKLRVPGPGRHVFVLENVQQKRILSQGLHRLMVAAEAEGDEEPRNNMGAAAVTVTGRPRVLLVEGSSGEGQALEGYLRTQDIECARETPDRLTSRTRPPEEFVAVILAGVRRETLTHDLVRMLRNYVEVSGGGLWIIGSKDLEGDRGYARTDLEEMLPVTFAENVAGGAGGDPGGEGPTAGPPDPEAPEQRVLAPTLALLFIIDKSGSMAGKSIALCKEAVIESAKTLDPKDAVGVLAFDVAPKWIMEFTGADRQEYIEDRVMRLLADGGTNIHPALVEALRAFHAHPLARPAGIKHAILLSDGDTPPADFDGVVGQMAKDGITVTTVCVGAAGRFDLGLMNRIAQAGKGRPLFTASFKNVPQIFMNETKEILKTVPRDEKTPPSPAPSPRPSPSPGTGNRPLLPVVVRDDHEILQGIERRSLPPLRGMLGAAARAGATVPLATEEGRPVLALWRFGLGKTAVWTSDASGRWTSDWLSWPGTGKLFAQLVRSLSSAAPDAELAGRIRILPDGAHAKARIDPGPPDETLTATSSLTRTALPIEPEPDGGGRLSVPLDQAGEMHPVLLQRRDGKNLLIGALRAVDPEFLPGRNLFSGAARPLSWEELATLVGNPGIRGDRRMDLSLWLIVAALALLPIDVALRRYER